MGMCIHVSVGVYVFLSSISRRPHGGLSIRVSLRLCACIYLSVCLYLSVRLSVCPYTVAVRLSVHLCICAYPCLPVQGRRHGGVSICVSKRLCACVCIHIYLCSDPPRHGGLPIPAYPCRPYMAALCLSVRPCIRAHPCLSAKAGRTVAPLSMHIRAPVSIPASAPASIRRGPAARRRVYLCITKCLCACAYIRIHFCTHPSRPARPARRPVGPPGRACVRAGRSATPAERRRLFYDRFVRNRGCGAFTP